MNQKLNLYIRRRESEPTVILCFRILLDHTIQNGLGADMSKTDIETIFNSENSFFGIQTFRRDYVMRQSGNEANAIDEINERFFIRAEFLEGVTIEEMREISSQINSKYENLNQSHLDFLNKIQSIKDLNLNEREAFIRQMLLEYETDRRGQAFEVTSYSILKVFFIIRGFELNRFSTIYSNDGGVDFAGQSSIYQVAGKLSLKKFNEDIKKAPLKKRVMVYKELTGSFDKTLFEHELILDYIDPEDLLNHLDYLLRKNGEKNSRQILDVMEDEFRREYYIQN